MAGQTINDRLLAARHSLAGQGLAKSVCKATTEEMIGPKKKHLDYLVHCTNEPNVSIPHLANLLIERSQNTNWVVVYKALITVHHLLAYGNERFIQYLASSNSTFNLSNFLDKGGVQGAVGARIGYDMSPFIRRYAKYLNEKALSYRTVAFDFCKVKRGKEEGSLRTMNADKLLKTLPVLQAQLDGLLEFDCSANDLTNGVINMCFMLLFRDLIRLFACYNDGIINLLEKYFDMNKKQCRDALDLYKKFLVRMDRVGEFLKVAENVGIDKGDIPDLTKAPSSLLDALEQHLATLEGRKGSAANTPTQSASNQKNVKSGVSALSSTSSSFGTAANSTRFDTHANGIDESIKAQALAEEEAAMNQYKSKVSSPTNTGGSGALTNPFLSSPPASLTNAPIVDLFGSPNDANITDGTNAANTKASDDLLQLGNPFADMFGAPTPAPIGQPPPVATGANNMWMSNGFNGSASIAPSSTTNTFVSESNFTSVFGTTEPATLNNNLGHYSLQAATDDTPNPFLLSDSDETAQNQDHITQPYQPQIQQQFEQQQHQQIQPMQQKLQPQVTGEDQQEETPDACGGIVDTSKSCATFHQPDTKENTVSQGKSALEDLNDSIRIALGSPAKTVPVTAETVAMVSSQQIPLAPIMTPQQYPQMLPQQQSMSIGVSSAASGYGMQPHLVYMSSPAKQPSPGGIQQQVQQPQPQPAQNPGKILTGDLDSSLASLVDNLNINKSGSAKGVQWNSPKNTAKPGANWTPQPMAATTGVGYRPMAQGMTVSPAPSTISPFVHATYPVIPSYMQQGMPQMQPMMGAPMAGGVPMMTPGIMQMGAQQGMPTMMAMPATGAPPGQSASGMMMAQQQTSAQPNPAQNGNKNVQLDPFGAL